MFSMFEQSQIQEYKEVRRREPFAVCPIPSFGLVSNGVPAVGGLRAGLGGAAVAASAPGLLRSRFGVFLTFDP